MRPDMKKIVVERPRGGSRVRNQKFGARLRYIEDHDYEDQPKKARGFESYHDGWGKEFTDVLNPLVRFLRSNVGRPWDKVYSELSANLDKRKTTGRHICQHVEQMVERECYVDEYGKVRYSRYRGYIFGGGDDQQVRGYYVHPRTGLLCEGRRQTRRERTRELMQSAATIISESRGSAGSTSICNFSYTPIARALSCQSFSKVRPASSEFTRLYCDNNGGYRKHEGIWYRVKLLRIVVGFKDPVPDLQDIFLKRRAQLNWGVNWIAVEKKQCNRQELKEVQRLLESGKAREPKA